MDRATERLMAYQSTDLLALIKGEIGIHDDLVAAARFRFVQRGIRELDEIAFEARVSLVDGNSETDGEVFDRSRTTGKKARLFDAMPQTLCDANCPRAGGFR